MSAPPGAVKTRLVKWRDKDSGTLYHSRFNAFNLHFSLLTFP